MSDTFFARSDLNHIANERRLDLVLRLNMGSLLLLSNNFLQLRNVDLFVVEKYLSIVGKEFN